MQGKFFDAGRKVQRPFFVYPENLVTRLGTDFTGNAIGMEGETVEVKTGVVFPKEEKSRSKAATKHYVTGTPALQAGYKGMLTLF